MSQMCLKAIFGQHLLNSIIVLYRPYFTALFLPDRIRGLFCLDSFSCFQAEVIGKALKKNRELFIFP